jgi:hypothetical protein
VNDPLSVEKSIFLQAIEITSAEERSSYQDAACRDNRRLRDEIVALRGGHVRPLGLASAKADGTARYWAVPASF